ncbi:MAG: trypsin-like serine protease, partial [Gemmataceae bacterium]
HTGVLVAPQTVLTSAHAFDGDFSGEVTRDLSGVVFGFHPYPLEGETYSVQRVVLHPAWPTKPAQHDLALLFLDRPVEDVTPARVFSGNPLGMHGVAVGYGVQSDGYGNELVGANPRIAFENTIDYVGPEDGRLLSYLGEDPARAHEVGVTLRSDFDDPSGTANSYGGVEPLALEGGTATGDSGGPLFVPHHGEWKVAGVLFGSFNPYEDLYGEMGYGNVALWSPLFLAENQSFLRDNKIEVLRGPQEVPEPGGLILAGLGGLLGVVVRRWQ